MRIALSKSLSGEAINVLSHPEIHIINVSPEKKVPGRQSAGNQNLQHNSYKISA